MPENDFSQVPTFLEYIDQVLHLRSARIIKRRAQGASLRDAALEEGLTRTEIRQLEKKALDRLFDADPKLQEDAYRYLYEHYSMEQEFFDRMESGATVQYYLKSRYEAGFMAMTNALKDQNLSEAMRRRLQDYYDSLGSTGDASSSEAAPEQCRGENEASAPESAEAQASAEALRDVSAPEEPAPALRELPAHILETIDDLWDIFSVGGITDSLKVLEQISIFLFLKALDDKELENTAKAFSEGNTVAEQCFDGAHQDCRWTYFRHLEANELYDILKNRAFPYIRKELRFDTRITYAKLSGDLKLQILDASMAARITAAIDSLTAVSSIRLSQLFDAMIERAYPSDGTLELICRLTRPTLEDAICSPFMDLTHPLCFFADYMRETYPEQMKKVWHKMHFHNEMFHGYSNANEQTILSIAALRMLLRGIDSPAYQTLDILSQTPERKFTRVVTEIPAGAAVNMQYVKESVKSFISANQPILLCMYACHGLLEDGGICAMIVPHRALTDNSASHRKLRRFYVDQNDLLAVIHIPESRKDILIYQKCAAPESAAVWFARMDQTDGTAEYLDVLTAGYFDLEDSPSREAACFRVPLSEIRETQYILDYGAYSTAASDEQALEEPKESLDAVMRRIYNTQSAVDASIREIKEEMGRLS